MKNCAGQLMDPGPNVINSYAELPVIMFHNDVQTLHETVANYTSTSIRLSLVCAAYGEPDYPIITWSSPIDGIEDYSILATNNPSINIVTDQLSNTRVTVSTLELCNVRPENLTEYLCEAVGSNNPGRQNMSLSRILPPLGAFGVTYSFASGNVEVALSYYDEVHITLLSLPLYAP